MPDNSSQKRHGLSTKAVHTSAGSENPLGTLATPIYQTSTFVFPTVEAGAGRFAGEEPGYIYTRLGNPTVEVLERTVAELESAEAGLAFASGMAAISAVIMGLVQTGDHILSSKGLYGCTFGLLNLLKNRFGVHYSMSDMSSEQVLENALLPNTKIIYVETPINPTMELVDLAMISNTAKQRGITVIVDNTFMSPYLQRPIELGCDIVVHSATKYIGGHGDVIAGVAVGPKDFIERIRMTTLKDIGGILSPFDAYLLIRGIKTLAVRMDRHCMNAQKVAEYLESHPKIANVYYPGLKDFPQHELAKQQMDGFGGLISFELQGGIESGIRMLNELKLCKRAVSLGDVNTLIQHPASMTHSVIPAEERAKMGISDGLFRLSVGIEDAEDIMHDLQNALKSV